MAPASNPSSPATPANAGTQPGRIIRVPVPAAGQSITVDSAPNSQLNFEFDPQTTNFSRSENSLVFRLDSGGTVMLRDFFAVGDQPLPLFVLADGTVIPTDFLPAAGIDMTTAAGPQQQAQTVMSGGTNYYDDSGELIGGLDRLGNLGTDYWSRETTVTEFVLSAQEGPGAATIPNHIPTITPDGNSFRLSLHEDGLANGTMLADAGPHSIKGAGGFTVDSGGEGLLSITIGGKDIPLDGTGGPVTISDPSDPYTVIVTKVTETAPGVYTVEFTYELTGPYHHGAGVDSATPGDYAIVVTDANGDVVSDRLTVTILDDSPVARPDENGFNEDQGSSIMVDAAHGVLANDLFGADGPAGGTPKVAGVVFGADTNVELTTNVGKEVAGNYGTLLLNPDGSYTYSQKVDVPPFVKVSDVFTYTIKDGDGDWKTTTLSLSITGKNEIPTIDPDSPNASNTKIVLHEDGLANGTGQADTGPHTTASVGYFVIDSHLEGLQSLTIGGHTIALDGTFVPFELSQPTDVYTLTITDVYKDASGKYTISYEYRLNDAYKHAPNTDSVKFDYEIVAKDTSGDDVKGALSVTILDDNPVAVADLGILAEENHSLSVDAAHGVLANDKIGADGPVDFKVQGVSAGSDITVENKAGVGSELQGTYGKLTLNDDGSYKYVLTEDILPNKVVDDVFTYTIKDADGDWKTTTLTIRATGTNEKPIIDPDNPNASNTQIKLHEDGLANGTGMADAAPHTTEADGFFTVDSKKEGLQSITIDGKDIPLDGPFSPITLSQPTDVYTVTITGVTIDAATGRYSVHYHYKLNSAYKHDTDTDSATPGKYEIIATDISGDSVKGELSVTILDDNPVAVADTDFIDPKGAIGSSCDGNVLTNDKIGADGQFGGGSFRVMGAAVGEDVTVDLSNMSVGGTLELQGTYGKLVLTSDGNYVYSLTKALPPNTAIADVFTYTIKDADGDWKTTTLSISTDKINPKPIISGATEIELHEDGLVPGGTGQADTGPHNTHSVNQFIVDAQFESLKSLTIGGHDIPLGLPAGTFPTVVLADTAEYKLVIIDVYRDPGGKYTVTYSYELKGPYKHGENEDSALVGAFEIVAIDETDDETRGFLNVTILDDSPIAVADFGDVKLGETSLVVNAKDGVLANDKIGADGPVNFEVQGVAKGDDTNTECKTGVGAPISGEYGTLTLNKDGSYKYEVDPAKVSGGKTYTDIFTYTIKDADGDWKTTTLTITIDGGKLMPSIEPGVDGSLNVDLHEDGLPKGTKQADPGPDHPTKGDSSFVVDTHGEGLKELTIGGKDIPLDGAPFSPITVSDPDDPYTVTITDVKEGPDGTYTIEYEYELTEPYHHAPNTDVSPPLTIDIVATDTTDDTKEGALTFIIHDDKPVAEADFGNLRVDVGTLTVPAADGVLKNDMLGADGGDLKVLGVDAGDNTNRECETTNVGQPVHGDYGTLILNEDGSYSYVADPNLGLKPNDVVTDVFTYTIKDADGDWKTTTLTIRVMEGNAEPIIQPGTSGMLDIKLHEDGLVPDGTRSADPGPDHPTKGTSHFEVDTMGEGLKTLTIDGHTLPVDGSPFAPITLTDSTDVYTVIITKVTEDNGKYTVEYTYELNGPYQHDPGSDESPERTFAIVVEDASGDQKTGELTVVIYDDKPLAEADFGNLTTKAGTLAVDADKGVLINDKLGADGGDLKVLGVDAGNNTGRECEASNVGKPIHGAYGTLTLNADGSYSYVLDSGLGLKPTETVTDVFTYTIKDADGDWKTTTLTITARENPEPIIEPGVGGSLEGDLHEDGLPGGSGRADAGPEHPTKGESSFVVDTQGEGLKELTIGGKDIPFDNFTDPIRITDPDSPYTIIITDVIDEGNGKYTIEYEYELTDPYEHDLGEDMVPITIDIVATDTTDDTKKGELTIRIHDDKPVASHDLSDLKFDSTGQKWHAEGNVLTSEGSAFTADNTGSDPAWVKPNADGTPAYKDTFGADGPAGGTDRITSFTYTAEDGTSKTEILKSGTSVTVTVQGGGTLTMYSDGKYEFETAYQEPKITYETKKVEVVFGDEELDRGGFAFAAFKSIATNYGADSTLDPTLTLAQVRGSDKAQLVYDNKNHAIGVSSGQPGDSATSLDGSKDSGEGILISATSAFAQGLRDITIQLNNYGTDDIATVAVFDLAGKQLNAADYTLAINNGVITIEINASAAPNVTIADVLIVADTATASSASFSISGISGNYREVTHIESTTPHVEVVYTIEDKDGDSSSASLVIEPVSDSIIVGSSGDDRPGSSDPFVVPSDDPNVPNKGTIEGGTGDDILLGDATGVSISGEAVKDYNICIVLDLSSSMTDETGEDKDGPRRIDIAKEALAKVLQELSEYQGQVNIKLVTFADSLTSSPAQVLELNNNNYQEQIQTLIDALNSYEAAADGATNYEQAFMEVLDWFTDSDGAANDAFKDYVNKVLFVTDGNPSVYGPDGTDGPGYMPDQDTFDAAYKAFLDLINSGKGIAVSAIGIGKLGDEGLSPEMLRYFDNTTDSGFLALSPTGSSIEAEVFGNIETIDVGDKVYGEVDIVNTQADLDAALARGLAIEKLRAGNDVILGGAGNDWIFGDVINTDTLATQMGVPLPAGSGWSVFAYLETETTWTREDTLRYIQVHGDELGKAAGVEGGDDLLVGGTGNDTIYGQDGNDLIVGGDLHFAGLHGNAALAHLFDEAGGSGASTGELIAYLSGHMDQIGQGVASDGNNLLNGGVGNNFMIGGGGNDTIFGGTGNDTIFGGAGNDSINGGAGNDLIFGGQGNNTLTGGLGADTFAWNMAAMNGKDVITDFSSLEGDKLSFGDLLDGGSIADFIKGTHIINEALNSTDRTVSFTIDEGSSGQKVVEIHFATGDAAFNEAVTAYNSASGNIAAQEQAIQELLIKITTG